MFSGRQYHNSIVNKGLKKANRYGQAVRLAVKVQYYFCQKKRMINNILKWWCVDTCVGIRSKDLTTKMLWLAKFDVQHLHR